MKMRFFILFLVLISTSARAEQCSNIWASATNTSSAEPDTFKSNGNSDDVEGNETFTGNEFIFDTLLVKKNKKLRFVPDSGDTVIIYVNQLKLEEKAKINDNQNVNLIVVAKSDIVFEQESDAWGVFYSKTKIDLKGSSNSKRAKVVGSVASKSTVDQENPGNHVTFDANMVNNATFGDVCTGGGGNNIPTDITLSTTSILDSNTGVGATVATLSTTDTDSSDTFTYSLASSGTSSDGGSCTSNSVSTDFQIDGSTLETAATLAVNNYSICLLTTDSSGGTYKEEVTIAVEYSVAPTFYDKFDTQAYNNEDGQQNWSASWQEISDDGSPSSGNVLITGGELVVNDNGNGAYRSVNLSSYGSATLSYNYRVADTQGSDEFFRIQVSVDNSNWTTLASYQDDGTQGTASISLNDYMEATVYLRVFSEGDMESSDYFYLDNFAVAASGTPGTPEHTFFDKFSTASYSRNDGEHNFASDWIESNDDGTPGGNDINIISGELHLQDDERSIKREVDLSAYGEATLSFDYREDSMSNSNDYVDLRISTDGGSNWTTLTTFNSNMDTDLSYLVDISSYISSQTQIQFLTSPNMGNGDDFYVDNFAIDASGTPCVGDDCLAACSVYFTDTLQGNNGSAYLEIEDDGQIKKDDGQLIFPSIDLSKHDNSSISCETTTCTVTGGTSTAITAPTFQTTSATTDLDLDDETSSIGSGGTYGITEIDNLTIGDDAVITFNSADDTFKIDNALFEGTAKITFNAGTYWFNELEILDDTEITINGAVTFYVKGDSNHLDIEDSAKINIAGDAKNLAIVSWNQIHLKGSVEVHAVLYNFSRDIQVKDDSKLFGVISAAEKLEIKGSGVVEYEDPTGVKIAGVCATAAEEVHHYLISHDGGGLTCLAESIQIQACKDSNCSETIATDVIGNLTSTGTQSSTALSFNTGSQNVNLSQTSSGSIILGLSSMSPTATDASPIQCLNTSDASSSCQMTFADTGYLVSIPDSFVASSLSFAASNSGTAATVQAVKADNASNTCVPLVGGDDGYTGNQTVNVTFNYSDPNTGTQSLGFSADDASYSAMTAGNALSPTLNFSAGSATADFYLAYPDVGQLTLTFTDPNGVLIAGSVATGTDSFIVYPNNLTVTMPGGVNKAGEGFNLTISAVDIEGNPLPNYQPGNLELNPTMLSSMSDDANSTAFYYSATGNISASKTDNWAAASLTFSNGSYSTSVASFDNVGEFQVNVRDTYMGQSITTSAGASTAAGRFTPAYFDIVEVVEPEIADTNNNFSYYGETLDFSSTPKFQVVAKNYKGQTATNYDDALNMFTGGNTFDLTNKTYTDSGSTSFNNGSDSSITLEDETDWDGIFEFELNDSFEYSRDHNELASHTVNIDMVLTAADLTDADGIGYDANGVTDGLSYTGYTDSDITGTEVRYGRLRLENAYGPEDEDLKMEMEIEYWEGTKFILNEDDTMTNFSGFTGTLTGTNASDFTVDVVTDGLPTFTGGKVAGTDGLFVDVPTPAVIAELLLELGNVPTHLLFDWDGDDDIDSDDLIQANIIFGRYRGNDRIIYKKER